MMSLFNAVISCLMCGTSYWYQL